MDDAPSVDLNNPSQIGGPGITLTPLNPNSAPQPSLDAPPVESNPAAPASAPSAAVPPANPTTPAPSTEQPKVEQVPSEQGEDGIVIYDETGDPGLDLALAFIGKLGIAGTDPAMVAAANGDFTFLEAKLSTLGDEAKGWEKHVELGKAAFGRQLDAFKAEQAKTEAAVHAIAGGEANWKAVVAWAAKEATPEEKQQLNIMFDAGGFQAQAAARTLVGLHAAAKGTTITPANPAPAATGTVPVARATTAADYHKEVSALYMKLGNAMDTSPEYAALRQSYFGR